MQNWNAVINGDRIECGKCGALLMKHAYSYRNEIPIKEWFDYHSKKASVNLEIKCKHKDKGHTCNAINEILL